MGTPIYVEQLLAAYDPLKKPGTVTLVDILHDSWCGILNGKAFCNCQPKVQVPSAP